MAISSILLLFFLSATATLATCMRIEINHVDSKHANITAAERFRRAGARAHLRLQSFGVTAPVTLGAGMDYIAEFAMGSPLQEVHAVVDTMSSLVWTQCFTCRPHCFHQDLEVYDFALSSTAAGLRCNDSMCVAGYETEPCTGEDGRAGACPVRTSADFVADIAGVLRQEQFTFGSTRAQLAFGCITDTTNITALYLGGASGVLGLGMGALSLVSQVGGNRRFSYCLTRYLTDDGQSSALFVGPSAGLNGDAPFVSANFDTYPFGDPFQSFYYLQLSTVSVGKTDLNIPYEALSARVIIDSAYPFTLLADVAYKELRNEVCRQLGSSLVPPPDGSLDVDVCVAHADVGRLVPPLVLHFGGEQGQGGGDWTIPPENYWAPVDDDTSCMVVLNSAVMAPRMMAETSIIGNYMQQDMHVLYDLDNYEVSFQPADCSSI